jgi:carboxyl-terminal processing protease
MMLFSNVFNHVRTNYVEEVYPSKLIDSAIYGILSSLDPHCVYLDSIQYKTFMEISEGKSYGIGVEFEIIGGMPTVVSIIKDSPAENTSIHPGDMLLKINGKSTIGLTEPEIKLILSGEKGSEVNLVFKRPYNKEEFGVTIKRAEISINSINYYFMLTPKIGYIKIDYFSQTTKDEFIKTLNGLKKEGMESLVLDLRNNPGGVLQSAIDILDMFTPPKEVIFETKGRKEISNKKFYSSEGKKEPLYPIIVMINHSSASASEAVAGGLQDFDRALVVGTNSFGKGLVQSTFLLSNGGAVLMTISRYYTPSGRLIQREYKNKNFEDYYTEIFNEDSVEYKNSPVFKTKKGRTVYGGGGIAPDIIIKGTLPPVSNYIEVRKSIFKFITESITFDKKKWKNFYEFKRDFTVSDNIINDFIQKSALVNLDTTLFRKNVSFLKNLFKSEIAGIYWGKREFFIINLANDEQLFDAINYIPKTKELITQ